MALSKSRVVRAILERLREEFETFRRASSETRNEGSDTQTRAEGKYDTRATEASYLADGQAMQADLAAQAILAFESLGLKECATVDVGALVELRFASASEWFFLGPAGGGCEVVCDGTDVTVITPDSPLGGMLMGQRAGGRIEHPVAEVVSVR